MAVIYPNNITFAYDNIAFDASSIVASSQWATMLAENLRLQERGAFWRATGCDDEALTLALAKAKSFNFLGLVGHNLSHNATVRVQASLVNDFSGSTDYDETFLAGADRASIAGYAPPAGKVEPPALFFMDMEERAAGGNAVLLGADDAFSAADHADFKPAGAFTVGAWIKKSYTAASAYIFVSASTTGGIALGISPGSCVLYASLWGSGLGIKYRYGATNVCDGEWHHVAAVWDGTDWTLYVDGAEDNGYQSILTVDPAYAATNYVRVGCSNLAGTNGYFFNGSLDDVFLYNGTALTAAQVADMVNNGITITTNLKAKYAFASGALTTDGSGNSHTLTAISVPINDPAGGPPAGLKVYRYIKISFADEGNAAGYIELGVLWLGEYLESERQYEYGATDELVDPSSLSQSMGGQDWPDEEEMYLQLSFTIGRLSDEAKYFAFRQFFFAVRKTRFFLLLLQPGTALGRVLMSAYGRFTDNTKFSAAFHDNNDLTGLEFKEVR